MLTRDAVENCVSRRSRNASSLLETLSGCRNACRLLCIEVRSLWRGDVAPARPARENGTQRARPVGPGERHATDSAQETSLQLVFSSWLVDSGHTPTDSCTHVQGLPSFGTIDCSLISIQQAADSVQKMLE